MSRLQDIQRKFSWVKMTCRGAFKNLSKFLSWEDTETLKDILIRTELRALKIYRQQRTDALRNSNV